MMRSTFTCARSGVVGLALVAASAATPANAVIYTANFAGEGGIAGSFSYDSRIGQRNAFPISVTFQPLVVNGVTYQPAYGGGLIGLQGPPGNRLDWVNIEGGFVGLGGINLYFTAASGTLFNSAELAGPEVLARTFQNGDIAGIDRNYVLTSVSPVPEPGTWLAMIVGIALAGGAMRYRRKAATVSFA